MTDTDQPARPEEREAFEKWAADMWQNSYPPNAAWVGRQGRANAIPAPSQDVAGLIDDLRHIAKVSHSNLFSERLNKAAEALSRLASGAVTVPDDLDITGDQWSAGRRSFVEYAEQYRQRPSSVGADAVADIAPAEIYRAMLLASPSPAPAAVEDGPCSHCDGAGWAWSEMDERTEECEHCKNSTKPRNVERLDWTPELETARIKLCEFWVAIADDISEGKVRFPELGKKALETEQALTILGEIVLRTRPSAPPLQPAAVPGREIECHGLDTPERVCFYEQDFYVLSNFSSFSIMWEKSSREGLVRFDTSEAVYHWMKFKAEVTTSDQRRLMEEIRLAPSAHEAFKIAERNKPLRRPDWDEVKVDIMRDILRAKADQHEYVRRKLLATGTRELVENSWRDDFWGWGPNRDGKNMLGKLWMEVRAELALLSPSPTEGGGPQPLADQQDGGLS